MGFGVEEGSLEFGPEDGCRGVVPVLPFGVVGVVRELSFGLSRTRIVVSIITHEGMCFSTRKRKVGTHRSEVVLMDDERIALGQDLTELFDERGLARARRSAHGYQDGLGAGRRHCR